MAGSRRQYPFHLIEPKWQQTWEQQQAFRAFNPNEEIPANHPFATRHKVSGKVSAAQLPPKFYILDMFPYPSGAGLHVGHPEGYTATDILARYRRACGFNVLHPMGWDSFVLPAEQYAVKTGQHPRVTTEANIANFTRQIKSLGFSYDWTRELATTDVEYFKWTQWIFLKLYNSWFNPETNKAEPIETLKYPEDLKDLSGKIAYHQNPRTDLKETIDPTLESKRLEYRDSKRLAYVSEAPVNWCPELGTVLANEEIIDGRSERGGHPVKRMPLRQWMFRITAYADRLLADLALVEWPESTRTLQSEWIGRSEGAEIRFAIVDPSGDCSESLSVFTTRPDTLFGATYMVLAPEHPLVAHAIARNGDAKLAQYIAWARNRSDIDRQQSKEKTGCATGLFVVNPATGARIPVWTAEYVLMGYGTGAIMAVPAHDERDFDFARAFSLPIVQVVEIAGVSYTGDAATSGEGCAVNSANAATISLDGLATLDAKRVVISWLEQTGIGAMRVNYRLRDWLFSRQRYWGEPFPIVFDADGNHYPVSVSSLPLVLPPLADYSLIESDVPQPPLAKAREWTHTTAGAAGVDPALLAANTAVVRETNTMPGWAGSCWYYLRYCSPKDSQHFVSPEAERYWMLSNRAGSETTGAPAHYDPATCHAGGVDLYVGGSEHAVLHLLYARFWHKMLFDLGQVSTPEPMGKLFHQGLITSHAFQRADKTLVPVDEVEERGEGGFVEAKTGEKVVQIVAKMSKSLRNVVNPDDIIAEYGADTFRLYEMYMGPLEASKPWNTRDIVGVFRFLQRAWRLAVDERTGEPLCAAQPDAKIEKLLHRTIHKVAEDIERLSLNTAIAAMIELINAATRPTGMADPSQGGMTRDQLGRFARILWPFAPHFADELGVKLGLHPQGAGGFYASSWPSHDAAMLVDDEIELPVQIQGKVKARLMVSAKADIAAIEEIALSNAEVVAALAGRPVKKVVVVAGRMVNIVV